MSALCFVTIAVTLVLWNSFIVVASVSENADKKLHGNTPKEEIQKLFPPDVSPELQKLLTLLLQKFQSEWKDDVMC
jgi:hypothetical protein